MTNCYVTHTKPLWRLLASSRARAITAFTRVRSNVDGDRLVPIEVLISSLWRRRSVERRLHRAIQRLQRILPVPLPLKVGVVVQEIIMAERQLRGCYQISQRPEGSCFALIRIALQVDGRSLSRDEILAVLAEQYIALAMQSSGPSLLVPIDLPPPRPNDLQHPTVLRPDPLTAPREVRAPIA